METTILPHLITFKIVPSDGYKKRVKEQCLYSVIVSIFGPAMMIDPTKNILFSSNLASMFAHIFFALNLYSISLISPEMIGIHIEAVSMYQPILLCLIVVVTTSSFLALLLKEEHRQFIGLKMPWKKGPMCCENDDQLVWAMKRKSWNLLNFYSNLKKGNARLVFYAPKVALTNNWKFRSAAA